MTKKELTAMTVAELKALANKKQIALPAGAKKDDLIKSILKGSSAAAKKSAAKAKGGTKAEVTATASAKKKKTAVKKKKPAAKKPTTRKKTAVKKAPARKKPEKKAPPSGWQMPAGMEEPLMAQERVESAKFFTGAPRPVPPVPASLPAEYGEERVTLLARDPDMAFAYWEVPQARLERERSWFGNDSRLCIRIYDVTGVNFDGTNAASFTDQEVYERIGSWYFDVRRPAHAICADIGLRAPDGRFLSIVRSNVVTMPRSDVSDVLDEEWMSMEEDFLKLYGIPGWVPGGISSGEMQELLLQRRMAAVSSPGAFPPQRSKRK
jgi:hypothetical protein